MIKEKPDPRFAQILRSEIAANGFTVSEFARRIGVSRAIVNAYLSGICYPKVGVLIQIADTLNCSVDHILGRSPVAANS